MPAPGKGVLEVSTVEVTAPASVQALVRNWSSALGCTRGDALRSIMSCGIGYLLLTNPKDDEFRRAAERALYDLVAMAPKNAPVAWHYGDLETGQVTTVERQT